MHEIDLRLMRAAVAVAEELNFSRAAARLRITQPSLTKQIQELEALLNTKLFERDHQKVAVMDAGNAFVAEARTALLYHQRAIQAAKAAASGAEAILNVGQSPYVDPFLTSIISSVYLPLYPNLRLQTFSDYPPELTRRVAAAELDLAILAAGADVSQLGSVELSSTPLYVLLERTSDLATRREFLLRDLGRVPWILFASQVHPALYQAIAERALKVGADPSEKQHVTSAEQAAQLVKSTGGVAFLTKSEAWRVAVDGLTLRPLAESGLTVRTVVVARKDAGRLVSEFMRAIVKKSQTDYHTRAAKIAAAGLVRPIGSCWRRRTPAGLAADLYVEVAFVPAIWALDKPCNHALWFDSRAFDFRSAHLANVYGCKFFVSMFAHVTEWVLNLWIC